MEIEPIGLGRIYWRVSSKLDLVRLFCFVVKTKLFCFVVKTKLYSYKIRTFLPAGINLLIIAILPRHDRLTGTDTTLTLSTTISYSIKKI